MLWFWASLLAAALWGFSYAAVENVLKSGLSTFTLMAFYTWIAAPVFTFLAWRNDSLKGGVAMVRDNPKLIVWIVLLVACYFCGNSLVYWAIRQKNATAVSFIEITYPLFVALFSYALFQQHNLSPGTLAGGALVFTGVAVMYVFR